MGEPIPLSDWIDGHKGVEFLKPARKFPDGAILLWGTCEALPEPFSATNKPSKGYVSTRKQIALYRASHDLQMKPDGIVAFIAQHDDELHLLWLAGWKKGKEEEG